jgi:putative transposase
MPRGKKFTAEQIIGKLRAAEVGLAQGKTVPEVVRKRGVTEQTYYRWRREYGGLHTDQAKRLKDLEKENARLKRLLADAELDKAILREGASGCRRLVGEPQAGGADLATGGPESACETAEAAKALAWRRVVHPAQTDASESRLELRLRHGPDGGWPGVSDADDRGRVHVGVSRDRHGRTATWRASTENGETSCWTAKSSTPSWKRRCSSVAGGRPTTPSARTARWDTAPRLRRRVAPVRLVRLRLTKRTGAIPWQVYPGDGRWFHSWGQIGSRFPPARRARLE